MSEDKLAMKTKDAIAANIEALKRLFPEVVSEGKIDFEQLKTIMGENVAGDERYTFTWAGKRAAMIEAAKPITKTLRPCPAESKDWDKTQNIYIEGDNLDALKILQNTYFGKVKMIYIDPPYNTGKDFIYHDNFHGTKTAEAIKEGDVDAETGVRYRQNTGSNGYYHSDWCSMMYPRLKLARNLLRDDGVIFMTIGDDEITNLRKLADEIFGEANFAANFIWNATKSVTSTALVSVSHNYNVAMFKDINYFTGHRTEFRLIDDGEGFSNPDNDPRGPWKADPFQVGGWRPNQQYEIVNPNTGTVYHPNPGCSWKNDFTKYQELIKDNRIVFGTTGEGGPQRKRFIWEAQERGKVSKTWWDDIETTTNGTQLLKKMFDGKSLFDNPKPVGLLLRILELGCPKDGIVLDFFSGSGTTAHAVMKLNAEDGGKRKFIMVQLPEECPEGSEAAKAGYKNICEIGKERIRRAGEKIKEESPLTTRDLDVGFRVFKVDSSNMKDVFYNPNEVKQEELNKEVINIKDDRSGLDLLYGCLLDWGLPIDSPLEVKKINGNDIFVVDGMIMACFEQYVDEATIREMAKLKPDFVLFRELAFDWSASKINAKEIFKALSPNTKIKVL